MEQRHLLCVGWTHLGGCNQEIYRDTKAEELNRIALQCSLLVWLSSEGTRRIGFQPNINL